MKYKFILVCVALLISNVTHAQWHFTITSKSFNSNCNDFGAIIKVSFYEENAAAYSAKTYSSQEECENARRNFGSVNFSSGGCYARVTSTPCQGNTNNGGGNGSGFGGDFQGGSIYSSTAIGENYFTPNVAHSIPDQGRELEIKLEALNKSFQNATNGIKTGDRSFDKTYRKQSNEMPMTENNNEKNDDLFVFYPRIRNLIKENDFSDGDVIPDINNTISSTGIEWDKGLETKINGDVNEKEQDKPKYVIIPDAPKLDEQSFPNANIENVQRYFDNSEPLADIFLRNPHKLENYLEMQFESVSGFNLNEIKSKQPNDRTKEEKQALADYEAYRVKEMEQINKDIEKYIDNSKEKKEIDAAILALDVYGNDEEGYINQTNYKKLDLESLGTSNNPSSYNPITEIATAISVCNATENGFSGTGVHVDLYYNDITDTYVISCAGSDDAKDWLYNNAANVLGGEVPQYTLAKAIGDAINRIPQAERDKMNIEIVGHSLGGGMASVIGLTTGMETKTYNASTVPDSFLKENGLYDKVNNGDVRNISAYHTSTDLLTNSQQAIGASAIGIPHDIGDPATLTEKTKAMGAGAAVGAFTPIGALGGAKAGEMAEGHRMAPIARHFFNSNTEKKKSEWDYIHNAQNQLQKELRSAEIKQDLKLNY